MKYCTRKIVEWLINHDAIKSEDKELYEYALYSLWLLATPLFLAIIIGGCLGGVKEGIIIVIPFMLIRKFSGGYHAKHLCVCFVSSTILLSLCILMSFYLEYDWKLAGITIIAGIGMGYFSPIDHENKRLNDKEKNLYIYGNELMKNLNNGGSSKYVTVYPHDTDKDNTSITSNDANLTEANKANYLKNTQIYQK